MIVNLAYIYVRTMANVKRYNLQSIAIREFLGRNSKDVFLNHLNLPFNNFKLLYPSLLSRDIVFKNNSLVTRNSKLISPAYYFYYTKLVFDIVLEEYQCKKIVSFKGDNYISYYSGLLYTDINDIDISEPGKILFDHSFSLFQKHLKKYEGFQAVTIDLANFFDSIKIEDLLGLLYSRYNKDKVEELELFFNHFEIKTLPQFHYSIASSILSQEYLSCFDHEIKNVLNNMDIKMIRFVDDMYFFNTGFPLKEKNFHELLDRINKVLWKYNLTLNPNKVQLYVEDLFEYQIVEGYNNLYSHEKKIEEKAVGLLEGDFIFFIKEINQMYEKRGYNIDLFTKIFNNIFSIDGHDGMKVLKNFTFSKKWRDLDKDEIRYVVDNYRFMFFLPDILFTLYLNIYEYYEKICGRDEETIRLILNEVDREKSGSLRYFFSSLHYLIQRNFKKESFKSELENYVPELSHYVKKFIQ